MSFTLDCNCGKQVSVSPAKAGGEVECSCGCVLGVPSLGKMNQGVTAPTSVTMPDGSAGEATAGSQGRDASERAEDDCPYCGKRMRPGAILGDRYRLKWLPDSASLTLGIWAIDADPIGEKSPLSRPRIHGMQCSSCRRIVVDY